VKNGEKRCGFIGRYNQKLSFQIGENAGNAENALEKSWFLLTKTVLED